VLIPLEQELFSGGIHMNKRGIRRWALLGALVSGALMAPACERSVPREGTDNEGLVNEGQQNETLPGAQQPATGGSGFEQQQQQQGADTNIGAPGDSDPRELPQTDQGAEIPPADQYDPNQQSFRRGEERGESPPSK
jgi:hypothetical protein